MDAGRVICPLPETTTFSFTWHLQSDIQKCSLADIPYLVNRFQYPCRAVDEFHILLFDASLFGPANYPPEG